MVLAFELPLCSGRLNLGLGGPAVALTGTFCSSAPLPASQAVDVPRDRGDDWLELEQWDAHVREVPVHVPQFILAADRPSTFCSSAFLPLPFSLTSLSSNPTGPTLLKPTTIHSESQVALPPDTLVSNTAQYPETQTPVRISKHNVSSRSGAGPEACS
jgi:hypothetical protein